VWPPPVKVELPFVAFIMSVDVPALNAEFVGVKLPPHEIVEEPALSVAFVIVILPVAVILLLPVV